MKSQAIHRRRNKEPEKSYLFTARISLWREIESLADDMDVSIAHLIRESLRMNIASYRKNAR
jgi:hypothetical protein